MKILLAAPEVYPFISTGGLSGVTGSLPVALERAGQDVSVILPFYSDCRTPGDLEWIQGEHRTTFDESFGLASTVLPDSGVRVLMVSSERYFDRSGIYGPDSGSSFEDNAARFSFFCRAVAAVCESMDGVDILHCHDWQTGLVPVYFTGGSRPATVFTIHNARFQGNFPPGEYACTRLPWSLFSPEGLEFFGTFSFLKSGIIYSDAVTTVSPTYAEELRTPKYGEGMDGVLRRPDIALTGILNGIDFDVWNPATDSSIASTFSSSKPSARRECREDLLRVAGLVSTASGMVVGMVTRLTAQKGFDLVFPILKSVVASGASLVVLGTGEKRYESMLVELSARYPGRVVPLIRYDEEMARRIFAGCDLFLMPSMFEPCGLAQMISMRYGAVPLVRSTGGLADSVTDVSDGGAGFVFRQPDSENLLSAFTRAHDLFSDGPRWSQVMERGMSADNSWESRTAPYLEVFEEAIARRSHRTD